jgi:hypothetical protein
MEKNGYVLGPYGVELRDSWRRDIVDKTDKVFTNLMVEAYYSF